MPRCGNWTALLTRRVHSGSTFSFYQKDRRVKSCRDRAEDRRWVVGG